MDASHTKGQHGNDYSLTVRNFGPITEGDIELRPLTVFVGPSNTGKSYLATMIYALHRYFARGVDEFPYDLPFRIDSLDRLDPPPADSQLRAALDAWLTESRHKTEVSSLPGRVVDAVRSLIEGARDVESPLEREVVRCFGVDSIDELIRRPRAQAAEVHVDLPRHNHRGGLRYRMGIRRGEFKVLGKVTGSDELLAGSIESRDHSSGLHMLEYLAMLYESQRHGERDVLYHRILATMTYVTRGRLANPLKRRVYYLPADRTGVMHSHKVVVSALVQRAAIAGLRPAADVPILSGVLADFLEQLVQMAGRRGRRRMKKGNALASRVEKTVLQGRVDVESSDVNYPHFVYRPHGWKVDLPLMRSSSMVSELAPIVLYLRHVVRPGDVLVIEEPESHLHPAMQVEVIRRLAEVVRSGIRVVVTTHSEWVLDELANMVQSSKLDESSRPAGNGVTTVLYPHEVGAWLFRRAERREGVMVEELKIDDTGLYPSGFDQVAVELHNRWASIVSRVQETKE